MKPKTRKYMFVAGAIAAVLFALALLAGIVHVAIVTVQTVLAD